MAVTQGERCDALRRREPGVHQGPSARTCSERHCRWEPCCGRGAAGEELGAPAGAEHSQLPPASGQGGARSRGSRCLPSAVGESRGRAAGEGCSGAESVSAALTVCHRAVIFLSLRRAGSRQQKSRQSSGVCLHEFLTEGKKCSCVE